MKKIFLSMPYYTGEKQELFESYIAPRNKQYCKIHGYRYLQTSLETAPPTQVFQNVPARDNIMFFRWKLLQDAINGGTLNDGDIINLFDCDVYIAHPKQLFETKKSFTYAIDSGNTHCMGIFSLKVNDFTRKLINGIVSQERYDVLSKLLLYKEDIKQEIPFYACDQHAFYHVAGIKPHSWVPFLEMPNYGFHSCKTDYTLFSVEELLENIEVLGPEWNTTHLVEETGTNGTPNMYDIVRTTKDKVINRHFAGGQSWLCKEWSEYSKRYNESTI
jgi:hypothetical protein